MLGERSTLPTSWAPDRTEFFSELKISQVGLGAQFFNRVSDALFVHSIDLKEEYQKYYSVEYATLRDYIETTFGEELTDNDLDKNHIFLVGSLPQIVDHNYDENSMEIVMECIKRLEGSDEGEA